MEQIKVGNLYLFKDGEIKEKSLLISDTKLKEIMEKFPHKSIILYSNDDNDCTIAVEEAYKSYLDAGYSLIVCSKDMKENEILTTCLLPLEVHPKDASNILNMFTKIEKNNPYTFIKNRFIGDFGLQYDFYTPSLNKLINSSSILDLYLREKNNQLTAEEQEMFNKYRVFNLKELLTAPYHYPVNNGNCGVMIVTFDNIYQSTNKQMAHAREFRTIKKYLYPNQNNRSLKIVDLLKSTTNTDVFIEILPGSAVVWMPDQPNKYQLQVLKEFLEKIEKIENQLGHPINVFSSIYYPNDNYKITELENIKEHFKK